jgi:WD40 repeat protein
LELRTRLGQCKGQRNDLKDDDDCPAGQGVWIDELALLQPRTGEEVAWDLPAIRNLPPVQRFADCGTGGQMKYWAFEASQLLYARCGSAYIIRKDGSVEPLRLQMPGTLSPFAGMSQYSLSSDARHISYTLYTRDSKDKETDRAGKLYRDLVVQSTSGSLPIAVTSGYTDYRAVLSPEGTRIAYSSGAYVKILTLAGDVLATIAAPEAAPPNTRAAIQELRWSPDGNRVAARINRILYVATIPSNEFKTAVRDDKITSVDNLAWSPDGKEIAFRSAHEGEQACSYGPQFSGGAIVSRLCAPGYRLYSVNVGDGSVRRLNASTEYRPGQLFWIQ